MKQAEYHAKLEEIDAYTAPARAAKLLNGLGFSQEEHSRPVKSFSGGWRMRLNLAQALICRADLLLLDEPTNHLDLETVLWLENHLASLPCTQIIISHDRDFLNAATTQTIELSQQKLTQYGGNYDFYQNERAQRLAQQQAAYVKQQAQIKHLQSFIDRFKAKATKAVQAQSRMKALAKLERVAPAHLDSEFSFEFYNPDHLPNPLLKLEHADLGYEGKTVLHDITLSLESGARYGLLGVNGSGKSTFIKALAGKIDLLSGSIVRSEKLNIGYFAQHQLDTIRADQSPVWHIQQLSPEVREQEIRNFLGGFNFVGDMALQKTEPFSGGEKARLALAMIIWQKPNLLLLDEPTNHLDLDMRHALTLAVAVKRRQHLRRAKFQKAVNRLSFQRGQMIAHHIRHLETVHRPMQRARHMRRSLARRRGQSDTRQARGRVGTNQPQKFRHRRRLPRTRPARNQHKRLKQGKPRRIPLPCAAFVGKPAGQVLRRAHPIHRLDFRFCQTLDFSHQIMLELPHPPQKQLSALQHQRRRALPDRRRQSRQFLRLALIQPNKRMPVLQSRK